MVSESEAAFGSCAAVTLGHTKGATHRFAKIGRHRLHYLEWSGLDNGRTFLLLHGGAANAHWWDKVAPLLTKHGRVIALDFRGHGRSEWDLLGHYGPTAYIEDTVGCIEHLGGRVVLVGHSMGGAVAQWTALERPEMLQALVVVDSRPGGPSLWQRLKWRWRRRAQGGPRPELRSREALVSKFRLSPPETYLTQDELHELALLCAEQLPNGRWAFRFDPETRSWRRRERRGWPRNINQITVPTLILRGAQSGLVTVRDAQRMQRMIRGSQLVEIPRAYHHVPLDNPTDTAAAIIKFVKALPVRTDSQAA